MKIIITSLIVLLYWSGITFAQPVIDLNQITPELGDVFISSDVGYEDVSGQTGVNQIWDFSGFSLSNSFSIVVIPVDEGLESEEFPNATICAKGTDSSMELELYEYFSVENSQFISYGNRTDVNGFIIGTTYTNPKLDLPASFSYLGSGTDTYEGILSGSFGSDSDISGEVGWQVVGYGTVVIDGITFSDVLQVEYTNVYELLSDNFVQTVTEQQFRFYVGGIHFPLAIFTQTANSMLGVPVDTSFTGTITLPSNPTGISENAVEKNELIIYPNPVNEDVVNIDLTVRDNTEYRILLYSAEGLLLKSEYRKGTGKMVDEFNLPKGLSPGVYHLVIDDGFSLINTMLVVE